MSTAFKSSLTILFEAPFWIGLYERTYSGKYEVCKITFGSEPKDYEVRKAKSREQKEAEKDRQFAIRQEKKKAKHRGR